MRRIGWRVMTGIGAVMALALSAAAGEGPWRAPAEEKAKQNPVPRDAGVRDGKKVFDLNCRLCHGPGGKGDGPAAAALNPKPRDLTDKAVQGETDGELFWKISEGRGAMPPWQQLPENVRWSLVHYVRTFANEKE